MAKVKMQKPKKAKAPKPRYNMWQNSRFMIKLAWTSGEKKVIILSLLSAALAVALNLINLYVSPTILSAVERRVSAGELFLTIVSFVLGLMLVSAVSAYVNTNTLFGRISVRAEIMNLLNRKAATTSYPNVDDDKFIKLLAKSRECTNSSMEATEAIWTTLTMLTTNIFGFLIYVSLLTTMQPLLILVILATTLASFFIGNYVSGYGYRHREEEAEYERHMNYLSMRVEDLSAAKDIRIFGLRPWMEELYEKAMHCYTAFHKKAQGVYIWSPIADLVLTFLRNAIAYAFLISLVIRNGLGAAEFLLYFTAVGGFTGWVSGILSGFDTLYKQSLDLSTVRECLEYYEPFRFDGSRPIEAKAEREYEIRLECVSFRYPGDDQDTLTNIDLTLHPGEKLAVVGLNGAGKTTLIKLICGFLDPTEGRVLLDGIDIRNYDRADYYTMFSAVFQDFSLLAGTIATNVAQSNVGIDMERVRECVEKAGLRPKVESLPDGYETYLNRQVFEEATLLSGGETQRLMLARALYKNAPFIILDEPTAALDPIAESEMYQKYHEVTGGRSSIYISHRLASTRFCDRIILIDDAGLWWKVNYFFLEKLLDMDYVSRDDAKTAELLSIIRQNQGGTGWGLHRVIRDCEELCSAVFTLVGGIALTVSLFVSRVPESAGAYTILNNPLFVVLMIAVMLMITYIAPVLSNKAESYWALSVKYLNQANRLYAFFGSLGYHREIATDVRMYRQEKICENNNRENRENTFGSKGLMAKYGRGPMGLYNAASSAISVIFTGVVYAFVCLKAWAGAFGLGAVAQYVASITKVSGGMSGLISALGDMRNNAAFLVPIFEFLDIPNNMYQGSLSVEKRRDRKYDVEFRNVSFKYPGSDNYALRNVSMKFEIGRRMAVVGMNGSGKTTFIKLLCRLYDPTEGEILLNGIDIRKYNYAEYMMIFSVVFQDFQLFASKLGENVASGIAYDRGRVTDSLKKAGFAERLSELPDGVETYLYKDYDKNGINISGGEAQKIAIARALYKDAPFIILDEPTAALDPIAEAEIYSKFNDIAGDRTAIYISHRLSSCKFCDMIAVFHEGAIIQQGTHDSLVADENGKYYELWHTQAQYYTE